MLTLGIVDDHRLFREGLISVLSGEPDFKLAGEAGNAHDALNLFSTDLPDVLLLDIALPGTSGIACARELLRRDPHARILALSMMVDEEHVAQALEAGILGYAAKDQSSAELFQAIRTVAQGKGYLSPLVSRTVIEDYMRLRRGGQPPGPLATLTAREREIFDLTVVGHSTQRIARELFISPRTVETHRGRIMRKLNVHSAAGLVRYAALHGLLKDENGATQKPGSA